MHGRLSKQRFIRQFKQWQSIYSKYSVAATCCGQFIASQVLSHRGIVSHLHGQCLVEDADPFAAVLYDEFVRREWHHKASMLDISWNLGKKCKHEIPQSWFFAKSMIQDVLCACDIITEGQLGVHVVGQRFLAHYSNQCSPSCALTTLSWGWS